MTIPLEQMKRGRERRECSGRIGIAGSQEQDGDVVIPFEHKARERRTGRWPSPESIKGDRRRTTNERRGRVR